MGGCREAWANPTTSPTGGIRHLQNVLAKNVQNRFLKHEITEKRAPSTPGTRFGEERKETKRGEVRGK